MKNIFHSFRYTSFGALFWTRNSSMGPALGIDLMTHLPWNYTTQPLRHPKLINLLHARYYLNNMKAQSLPETVLSFNQFPAFLVTSLTRKIK